MPSGSQNQGQQSQSRQGTSHSAGYGGSGQNQQGTSHSQGYGVSTLTKPEPAHQPRENEASSMKKNERVTNSEYRRRQEAQTARTDESALQWHADNRVQAAAAQRQEHERQREAAAVKSDADNEEFKMQFLGF